MKPQKTQIAQEILRKKKKPKAGGISILLPDFQLYYKAIVIKPIWDWDRNRHVDLWNRTESPDTKPCLCGQSTKEARI